MSNTMVASGPWLAMLAGAAFRFGPKNPTVKVLPVKLPALTRHVGIITLKGRMISPVAAFHRLRPRNRKASGEAKAKRVDPIRLWTMPRSFHSGFDAGLFDDRPPLVDFGLVQGGEHLRRLLGGRENLLAKVVEARTHRRLGQGRDNGRIEFRGDSPAACPWAPTERANLTGRSPAARPRRWSERRVRASCGSSP